MQAAPTRELQSRATRALLFAGGCTKQEDATSGQVLIGMLAEGAGLPGLILASGGLLRRRRWRQQAA
jgi:hypothetical protein